MSSSLVRHNGTAISGQSTTLKTTTNSSGGPAINVAFVVPTAGKNVFDWPLHSDELFWTYLSTVCLIGVCLNAIVIRSVLRRSKLSG